MTVYVDDMLREARVRRGRPAKWSHMFADTPAELAAFARRLGLRPEWLQHPGTHREHYDVTMTVRARAIQLGAQRIRYPTEVGELMAMRVGVCRCASRPDCGWGAIITWRSGESERGDRWARKGSGTAAGAALSERPG